MGPPLVGSKEAFETVINRHMVLLEKEADLNIAQMVRASLLLSSS